MVARVILEEVAERVEKLFNFGSRCWISNLISPVLALPAWNGQYIENPERLGHNAQKIAHQGNVFSGRRNDQPFRSGGFLHCKDIGVFVGMLLGTAKGSKLVN